MSLLQAYFPAFRSTFVGVTASLAAIISGQREQSPPFTAPPKAATVEFVAETATPPR